MVCSNLLLIPGDIQEKLKDLFNTSKNIGHLIENGEIPTEIFFDFNMSYYSISLDTSGRKCTV